MVTLDHQESLEEHRINLLTLLDANIWTSWTLPISFLRQ